MNRHTWSHCRLWPALMLLAAALPLAAQYREYLVGGRVVDLQQQPVADVEITLRDNAAGRSFVITTDKNGAFKFAGLPHGVFQVTIRKPGYVEKKDEWRLETPQERMQKVEVPTIVLATAAEVQEIDHNRQVKADMAAATEKIQNDDVDGALALLNTILADDPNNANAHYLAGYCFQKKRHFTEAIREFEQVTAKAPDFAPGHYQLGLCLQTLGDRDRALECYRKVLQLDPKNVENLFNAGLIFFEKNKAAEAAACFAKALEQRPDDPEILDMAGRALIQLGDLAKALEHLQRARELTQDKEKRKYIEQLIDGLKKQLKK